MKKNIAVGALISALLIGILPVNGQARETVFDVNKIRLMKPNQGSGIEAYPDVKFNLLTNLQECREYNAKCYPYDNTGSLEVTFNQSIESYLIVQTLTKRDYDEAMRITLYNDFGESFIVGISGKYPNFAVIFDNKIHTIPTGSDYQLDVKLVGNSKAISLFINGSERAVAYHGLGALKSFKETFNGDDETVYADRLHGLMIMNDAN